jgi:hypothetical protein
MTDTPDTPRAEPDPRWRVGAAVVVLVGLVFLGLLTRAAFEEGRQLAREERALTAQWGTAPDAAAEKRLHEARIARVRDALAGELAGPFGGSGLDPAAAAAVVGPKALPAAFPTKLDGDQVALLVEEARREVRRYVEASSLTAASKLQVGEAAEEAVENRLTRHPLLQAAEVNLTGWWALGVLVILVMAWLLGWAIRGTPLGALTTRENRLSLSRLQLLVWTPIVLSAFMVGAGFLMGVDRTRPPLPEYGWQIWALLGISLSTTAASAGLNQTKREQPAAEAPNSAHGLLAFNTTADGPSVLDLFTGDEVGNEGQLDVSRFQQFLITALLFFLFVGLLVGQWWSVTPAPWGEWAKNEAIPHLSETFIALLGISHAGYLAFKAVPKTETAQQAMRLATFRGR